MAEDPVAQLPLLNLFTRLREAGLPLGLNEYQLALKAFQHGFGLQSYEALADLCCTLWIKSPQEKLLFDHHFELFLAQESADLFSLDIADTESVPGEANTKVEVDASGQKRVRWRWRFAIAGGGLAVAAGITSLVILLRPPARNCPAFVSRPVEAVERGKEYRYDNISVCKTNETDQLTLEPVKIPPGLEFFDNGDGTAVLQGVPLEGDYSSVDLWDLAGNNRANFPAQEQVDQVLINATGDRILTIGTELTAYQLLDWQGNQITSFPEHKGGIWNIQFNPEGDRILALGKGNTLTLRDLDGEVLLNLDRQRVKQAKFSPKDDHLVTVGIDSSVQIFDQRGIQVAALPELEARLDFVLFDPEGHYLVTVDEGNIAKLWDLKGKLLATLEGHREGISKVEFCPKNNCLLTSEDYGEARLWDLHGNQLSIFRLHQDYSDIEFSPDGNQLVSLGIDGKVKIQNLQGKQLVDLEETGGFIYNFEFTPQGDQLITYGVRKTNRFPVRTAKLWNSRGNLVTAFEQEITDRDEIRYRDWQRLDLEFNEAGNYFISHLNDDSWELWDLQGNLLSTFDKHKANIIETEFNPEGNRLLLYGDDGTVELWDLQDNLLTTFEQQGSTKIEMAKFLPNANGLLVYDKNGNVGLWNLQGELLTLFEELRPPRIRDIFNFQGNRFLVYKKNHLIELWNSQGKQLASFEEYGQAGNQLKFTAQADYLYGYQKNGSVALWDLQGNLLTTFKVDQRDIADVEFNPQANRFLIEGKDNTLELRDLEGNVLAFLEGYRQRENRDYSRSYQDYSWRSSPTRDYLLVPQNLPTARLWNDQGDPIDPIGEDVFKLANNIQKNLAGFSPTGEFFFTIGEKRQVEVWDTQGQQRFVLEGDNDQFPNVQFSPTQNQLLTWGLNESPILWNLQGEQLAVFTGDWGQTDDVQFSPDGNYLLTHGAKETILWNLQGERLTALEGHWGVIKEAKFSPNGEYLVSNSADNTVRLWNLQGKLLTTIAGNQGEINQALFSPDGQSVVTYGEDRTIRRWNLEGKELGHLGRRESWVEQVELSPTGDRLVTVSQDNAVALWDLAGNQLQSLLQPQETRYQVRFSPDGSRLYGSQLLGEQGENTLILWDLAGDRLASFKAYAHNQYPGGFRVSSKGDRLLVYGGKNAEGEDTIHLFDLQGDQLASLVGERWVERPLWLSPDGESVITWEEDGSVKRWNWQGQQQAVLGAFKAGVELQLQFSPDSNYVLLYIWTRDEAFVQVWTLNGEKLGSLDNHSVSQVTFNSQNTHLLTVDADNTAKLWDLQGRQMTLLNSWRTVETARFHPDGALVVIKKRRGALQLWDLQAERLASFKKHGDIQGWQFSPRGDQLVTYTDKSIKLWDLAGNELKTLADNLEKEDTSEIRWVKFSPDQTHLLTYDQNRQLKLWNLQKEEVVILAGHRENFYDVKLNPDSDRLITLGSDKNVRLWDLKGWELTSFPVDRLRSNPEVQFDPDEEHLLILEVSSRSMDLRAFELWDLEGNQLASFDAIDLQAFTKGILTHKFDTISWWDWQGNQLNTFGVDQGSINQIQLNAAGNRLLTLSNGRSVILKATDGAGNTTAQRFVIKSRSTDATQAKLLALLTILLVVLGLSVATAFPLGYLVLRGFLERKSRRLADAKTDSDPEPEPSQSSNTGSLVQEEMTDEIQVARAIRQGQPSREDYLPLTQRQMKQNWRYLRRFLREGPAIDLDVDATVKQVGSQGFLLNPILVPRRTNRTELLLLIDHDGSMVPFELLAQRLAETAIRGGRLASTSLYFFRNCPKDYLYRDQYHHKAERIDDLLQTLNPNYACVLIFSDAGAARGGLNPARYQQTQAFIRQLKQHIRYLAWLNPVPKSRWQGATAAKIAQLAPMLECDRVGLQTAITVLQGKPLPYGIS